MRRKHSAILTLLLLIGFVAAPLVLTWRQVRQLRLNQALIRAIEGKKNGQIAVLLAQGADPNTRINLEQQGSQRSQQDIRGFFAPIRSAWNLRNRSRQLTATVLRIAIQHDDLEAVRLLLDKGADPNARISKYGSTALMTACSGFRGPQLDIMRLLLAHGADVNARTGTGSTPRYEAVTSLFGSVNKTRLLLDHGADINAVDGNGISILMYASFTDGKIVSLLLERGANVHYRLKTAETILTIARENEDVEERQKIIRLLKKAGAKDHD